MSAPLLKDSPLDSERFGMRILRGRLDNVEPVALAAEIISTGCDVAIVRVPSGSSSGISGLSRWALPVQQADTLVHYRCDLRGHDLRPLRHADITFALAQEGDMPELLDTVARTFKDYPSHYQANLLFARGKTLAGYQQWARSHASGSGRTLWLARRQGRVVGFGAYQEIPHSDEVHASLIGVNPSDAGAGVYGDLIRHAQSEAKSHGIGVMKLPTQVGNLAVQKALVREGFHMFEALDTFHVNALLSCGETHLERTLTLDGNAAAKLAETCKRTSASHPHDAVAGTGSPSPMTIGLVAAHEFSRMLAAAVPKLARLLDHMDIAVLQPPPANQPCRLQVRLITAEASPDWQQAVLTIRNSAGSMCVIARADVSPKH